MPKSGYLQRQAIREQAIVLAVENTTQQLLFAQRYPYPREIKYGK